MLWSLYMGAQTGTFEEYAKGYDQATVEECRASGHGEPLLKALGNHSVVDRVKISNFLLDRGADASAPAKGDNVNALHVLFGVRNHDFTLEAPLLERILEGGADVNLCSPRFARPLWMLMMMPVKGWKLEPFLDVFFGRADMDLSLPIEKDSPYTQREFLEGVSPKSTERYVYAQAYLEAHPEPRR